MVERKYDIPDPDFSSLVPYVETRTPEQIESDAIAAAEAQAEETRRLFLDGYYPGLCDGAADGTCTHPVKHVLPNR